MFEPKNRWVEFHEIWISYDIEGKSKIVLFFYEKSVVKPLQRTNLLGGSITSADTEMR